MKIVILITNIICLKCVLSIPNANDLQMIVDFIESYEQPTAVIANVCWDSLHKTKLAKLLAKDKLIPIRFLLDREIINNTKPHNHLLFVVDINCEDSKNLLNQDLTRNLFQPPFRWFLLGHSDDKIEHDLVPEKVANLTILPDSQVVVSWKNNNAFNLYYIYKPCENSTWKAEYYGSWDERNRFRKSETFLETTSMRRLNIEGCEISICYVVTNNDSINHMSDGIDDHIDTISKVSYPTTNHLVDFLNGTRKHIFSNSWGYRVNGTWTGMTGFLVRGEIEIGGTPMFFTLERVSIVEYITSPTPSNFRFVFQQPKLSNVHNLFLLPFNTTVWYSSLVLVLLISLVVFLVAKWEWKKSRDFNKTRESDAGILRANVSDVFVLMFGAACQQGSPCELKGSLGRIVMLVLFLALMFLYTSYTASIVALLQSSSTDIKTLDDLLHSRLKFGVQDTVYNRYYFSIITEPTRKAIYDKKIAPPGAKPNFMTMDEGVHKMGKGLFAFHMETGVGYKLVGKYYEENQKCGLQEMQYLQVIDPWLAARKNSPYGEMYKIGTKRMKEHGLQYRENHMKYETKPKCRGGGSNFVSVSIVDCYPVLLILTYGCIIALFLLGVEILAHKNQTLIRRLYCFNEEDSE